MTKWLMFHLIKLHTLFLVTFLPHLPTTFFFCEFVLKDFFSKVCLRRGAAVWTANCRQQAVHSRAHHLMINLG